eukprot:scaffold86874_cov19-Tisochrysis_lutea.AAC.1
MSKGSLWFWGLRLLLAPFSCWMYLCGRFVCAPVCVCRVEGADIAHAHGLRLVRLALKRAHYPLVAELLRFIVYPVDLDHAGWLAAQIHCWDDLPYKFCPINFRKWKIFRSSELLWGKADSAWDALEVAMLCRRACTIQ